MLYLEERIGQVRLGDGGKDGVERGHITWMAFDHYTSRPTLAVARDENGQRITEVVPVMVAGDPDLHTHHTVPNAVFCPSGRVGSLDTTQSEGLIKETGEGRQGDAVWPKPLRPSSTLRVIGKT